LPAKAVARCRRLEALAVEPVTLIFYEAPHRLVECLGDMQTVFGEGRRVVLARELTKTFETVIRAPLAELLERVARDSNQSRGEIVLLVEGAVAQASVFDSETERLLRLLSAELPPKRAAAVAAEFTGLRKKDLYNWLVENNGG